ncbi:MULTISPECIES: 4-alpha-glucanotransferase [Prochlorococcus]|uniref:4-alpha-glucanotransferase n=1 Tax=Prochlorococcus TaxID=1218 RepID=UPI000533AB8B|nr:MULTISPECIES: 4-alpha-glucanotransferase [Prochlorococcus]KGG12242.1 4-alpha-glucanotransferase (amylomaltase) [Prochlorococcus sp. MIT 0601]
MDKPSIPYEPRFHGVLLHPSALPNANICGGFGKEARKWLKLLASNGISVWQVLPLSPADQTGSPYSSPSSFALNPWFLDVEDLVADGFLSPTILDELTQGEEYCNSVDFDLANLRSEKLGQALREKWTSLRESLHKEFKNWVSKQFWLEDHALFMELKRQNSGLPWWEWPQSFASHNKKELNKLKHKYKDKLLEHFLLQWHLERQWLKIKTLAKDSGVLLFGDLPFYVSRDSADVWANRSLFSVLSDGSLYKQSGVPPDYFSETGQLWGTPVYRWKMHKKTHFNWWRKRVLRQWAQFDLLRIDHFRALKGFWAVPGNHNTAQDGYWFPSPGLKLLKSLFLDNNFKLPLVAEDLGIITQDVELLRDFFDLPGMKILQFAFDGNSGNPYLPENINRYRSVVYTGTHDNPTTLSWWSSAGDDVKNSVSNYLQSDIASPPWKLIEVGLRTKACLFIAPIQDLLSLDDKARFNIPGTISGNWKWRLNKFDEELFTALKDYGDLGRNCDRQFENVYSLLN